MLINVLTKKKLIEKNYLKKNKNVLKPSSNNGEGGKKGKDRLNDTLRKKGESGEA
jgi:hypothetical protein